MIQYVVYNDYCDCHINWKRINETWVLPSWMMRMVNSDDDDDDDDDVRDDSEGCVDSYFP
jgi:hypothetical protein